MGADIGYLQIKINELKEEVNKLQNEIDKKTREINTFMNEFNEKMDNHIKRLTPLLETTDKINLLQNSILLNVRDEIIKEYQENINSFYSNNIKTLNEFNKKVQQGIFDIEKKLAESIDKKYSYLHDRIDNLVAILNNRGITNITSARIEFDKKRAKFYKYNIKKEEKGE